MKSWLPTILTLAENKQLQNELSEQHSKLAIINADEVIAREVLEQLPRP